jgi:serine/threonine protein kinase
MRRHSGGVGRARRFRAVSRKNHIYTHICDTISTRREVYELVVHLHSTGIVHGDLEPRNVARVRGGGFRLIDFSESRRHHCKEIEENKVQYVIISLLIIVNIGIDWKTTGSPSSPEAEVF